MSGATSEATRQEQCPTHGPYVAKHIYGTRFTACPPCAAEEKQREEARQESGRQMLELERAQARIAASGIPDRFLDRSVDSFVAETKSQTMAREVARAFADAFGEVLESGKCALFVGRPGTGKTHLACAIGMEVLTRWKRAVRYTTVLRAVRAVKATWSRDSATREADVIADLARVPLLILDEVGVQFGSEAERLILFDILNERYERRLPTLLISNLDVAGVKACLGERIYDRLREDACQVVVCDWSSYRGRAT